MMEARFRESVAEFCRTTAAWRRRKAEEYDRDARNLRTSAALEELADYVLTLPDDDERIRQLTALTMLDGEYAPGQRARYEIGRFRFHYREVGCDAFLSHLVELELADRREMGRFGGRLPEGDDPWGGHGSTG